MEEDTVWHAQTWAVCSVGAEERTVVWDMATRAGDMHLCELKPLQTSPVWPVDGVTRCAWIVAVRCGLGVKVARVNLDLDEDM